MAYLAIVGIIIIVSCNISKKKEVYSVEALLKDAPTKCYITSEKNEKVLEVRDKGIGNDSTSGGAYSFFETGDLRLYIYFKDKSKYSYSEEYDSLGNLLKVKGNPFVDYLIFKQTKDSTFLCFFFFSLNKKYNDIKIWTNHGDTLNQLLMYKSKFYTNMKCISFAIPLAKDSSNLLIYTKVNFKDTVNDINKNFIDTTLIKN